MQAQALVGAPAAGGPTPRHGRHSLPAPPHGLGLTDTRAEGILDKEVKKMENFSKFTKIDGSGCHFYLGEAAAPDCYAADLSVVDF